MTQLIQLCDVTVNNLRIEQVSFEQGKLHVFSGPSGSGKSSLAFDVLYAAADAKGCARGLSKVFRKSRPQYRVEGLPHFVVGIEQQLTHRSLIESVGVHVGVPQIFRSQGRAVPSCPACAGKGYLRDIDPARVVRNAEGSVTAGAFSPAVKQCVGLDAARWRKICAEAGIQHDLAWKRLPPGMQERLLFAGVPPVRPVVPSLRSLLKGTAAGDLAQELPYYTSYPRCKECEGWGFAATPEMLAAGLTLKQVTWPSSLDGEWLSLLGLGDVPVRAPMFQQSSAMARKLRFFAVLREIPADALVIFDEPAAGMTGCEARQMAKVLRAVQQKGHTVIAVEHRRELIEAADVVTEFGPGAGAEGGRIVGQGPPARPSAAALSGKSHPARRKGDAQHVLHAQFSDWYGFAGFAVAVPLQRLTCVCGPSGSGKTAYIEAAYAACDKTPIAWQGRTSMDERKGHDAVRRPHKVSPDPIGVHAGSTPATYTGLWDKVRDFYATLPESRRRKFSKSHFSFNGKAGQCPQCHGRGYLTRDDVHYEECPRCHGTRFKDAVLAPKHKGLSVADVNCLTMRQAARHFHGDAAFGDRFEHFVGVALEYLVLGQPSNSLSGGENLRVKIVDVLSKRLGDRSLYVLDNPCRGIGAGATGLLSQTLWGLAEKHTVLVAENDPALAQMADWLIVLGAPVEHGSGSRAVAIKYAGPPSACPKTLWAEVFAC